jgi:predicted RNA binding protein YcfA (HicA-like mRNA interferase family)
MSKREKLLEKMRQSPKGIRFEEIDALLTHFGFLRKQEGSHCTYRHAKYPLKVTVVMKKPFINSDAVRDILNILADLDELDEMN